MMREGLSDGRAGDGGDEEIERKGLGGKGGSRGVSDGL